MRTSCVGVVSFVEFLCGDSRNPSRGEDGDVELDARISKYILVFAFAISQLNLFISCIDIISHLYMLDIILHLY